MSVEDNESLQHVSATSMQMSTLIGILAWDPRRLPLHYFDRRKIEQQKKELLWQEVKVCVHSALFLHLWYTTTTTTPSVGFAFMGSGAIQL